MRRHITAALLVAALATGACSQISQAANTVNEKASEAIQTMRYCVQAVRVADAVNNRNIDEAVSAGEQLVEVAPDEIRDEAQLVLDAAREAQDGNPAALQRDDVQQAARALRTYTEDTCDPTS